MTARLLERVALFTLLFLALVPRVRDIGTTFDREFEGYQGAFFAIAAVNYERLGPLAAGGYPVLNLDLPGGSPLTGEEKRDQWLVYHNHPPTAGLLAWSSLKLLGPENWGSTWELGSAPVGIEPALRLPFLLFHLAALLSLWWLARTAFGPQVALITLALSSFLPVSAMYGTLVNFENPSLPFVLLALGAYGCFVRRGSRRALVGMGAAFMAGCTVTFAPAFFLPPLVLRSALGRKWREALLVLGAGGLGCALPILAQAFWSRRALESLGQAPITIPDRARVLFQPLIDGSIPLADWGAAQFQHARVTLGTALLVVALVGALLCLTRGLRKRWDQRLGAGEWPRHGEANVDLALPLALGAFLYLFAFYRHTSEEQWSFWLYVAPAAALLAARALHMVSLPLQRLRGGIAPLVLIVGTVMLGGLVRFEVWRAEARAAGPGDHPSITGVPRAPLPVTIGGQLAELLPRGTVGLHPSALGLNLASTWYAWRSLMPISSLEDPLPEQTLGRFGLGAAPRYVVLPKQPPAGAVDAVDLLRAGLGQPERETEHWQAWRR